MMMTKRLLRIWGLAITTLSLLVLTSCDSAKRTNYLQDVEVAKSYGIKHDVGIVVQKGDKLRITVTSLASPELALPFNSRLVAPQSTATSVRAEALLKNGPTTTSADTLKSYLVDVDGQIQFPILGNVAVVGMTLEQVSEHIRNLLVSGNYLKDAHVVTAFDNLRVYLLGAFEVNRTQWGANQSQLIDRGSFHLDNPQTNILELLARSGGLSDQANYSKLSVIRRVGHEYVYYRLDMLSSSIFDSPAFYLQQNDIIYAEYKYRTRDTDQKVSTAISYVSTAASAVLSALAIISVLKR